MRQHVKTLILSDLHLGTKGSKAKEVVGFLKQYQCDQLILNGDIIDGWQLRKSGKWKKKHTRFFRRILAMIEQDKTKVYYLRGNHDDFLDQIMPFEIGNLKIQRDLIYESFGKRYLITHGDIFDSITTNFGWLARLGDVGYTLLLWINAQYNYHRRKKGLPYFSLSQHVKDKVKSAVTFIDKYENELSKIAEARGCDGVICGHIHKPALKNIGDLVYMNSGDWVETMSALVEDQSGEWSLVYYSEVGSLFKANHPPAVFYETEEEDEPLPQHLNDLSLLIPKLAGFTRAAHSNS